MVYEEINEIFEKSAEGQYFKILWNKTILVGQFAPNQPLKEENEWKFKTLIPGYAPPSGEEQVLNGNEIISLEKEVMTFTQK